MRARTGRRVWIGCAATSLALAAIAVCGGAGGAVWLVSDAGDAWLAGLLERLGTSSTRGGRVEIGALDLSRSGVELRDVALYDEAGRPLAIVDRLDAELRWMDLLSREIRVTSLRGDGVVLDLGVDADGQLDLARLFSDPAAPPSDEPFRLPIEFDVEQVELSGVDIVYHTPDGTVASAAGLTARARVAGRGDRVEVSDLSVAGALVDPAVAAFGVRGAVAYDSTGLHLADLAVEIGRGADAADASLVVDGTVGASIDLDLRAAAIDLDALGPLFGAGLGGRWSGELRAAGTPARVEVTASISGAETGLGSASLTAALEPSASTFSWEARVDLRGLHLDALVPGLGQPVVLAGEAAAVGTGTTPSDLELEGSWTGDRQQLYGYDVNAVDARFRIADGALHLDDALLDGIIGAVRLNGRIGFRDGPVRLRVSGPIDAAMLAARGVSWIGGDGELDAMVETDLTEADAPVRVEGTVTYAPFVTASLRAESLTAPFAVTVRRGATDGTIALDATGAASAGWTADRVRSDGLAFRTLGGVTQVDGPLQLDGLTYPDAVTASAAVGSLTVRVDGAATAVGAAFDLGAHTAFGFPGTRGSLAADLQGDALDLRVGLQDGLRTTVAAEGRYDLAAARLVLDRLELSPTPRARWIAPRPVKLSVVEGGIADADVALASALGAVELTGRLATAGEVDATITARALQIDTLAELFPDRFGALGGELTGVARLTGAAADPRMDGNLNVRGLNVEGTVRSMDVDGTVTLAGGLLVPRLDIGAARAPLGRIEGAVPVRGGLAAPDLDWDAPATLSVGVFPGDIARVRHLTPLADDVPWPDGRFSGAFTLTGPLRDPTFRVAGVAEAEVDGWDRAGRVEFTADQRGDTLTARVDLRHDLYARATVDASARSRVGELFAALAEGRELPSTEPATLADDLSVRAEMDRVPAAQIGAWLGGAAPLRGTVSGTLALAGSPTAPVASGALSWSGGAIGRQPIDDAVVSLTPRDDGPGYRVHLAMSDPGGAFSVDGVVPLQVDLTTDPSAWPAGDLSLDVAGDVPLALLEAGSSDLRRAEGRLEIDGHVGGAPFSPTADLTARVDGGQIAYRGLGIEASDVALSIGVTNQTLTLHRAAAVLTPYRTRGPGEVAPDRSGRPRIIASGRADLGADGEVTLDGEVRLDDGPWLIATDEATLRADGRLSVGGRWPALRVRGDLEVVQGSATIDTAELAETAPLVLDPSISVARDQRGADQPAARPPPAVPAAYAAFDVDVTLDLQRNLALSMSVPMFDQFGRIAADLTGTDITARLGGALSVRLERGEPTLVGEVELLDGQVRMLRSTFDLERGTIAWAGGDPYEDAVLDIHAVAHVPGGSLSLELTGTAADPDPPVLSSEEYPDPNQQMAILITGRAPEDLTSLEGAGALLAQTVASNVLGGRSLGTLSFEPDGSVRIDVPVTPTFHAATLFCPLCTDPESNQLTIEGEWSILPRLVLSGAYGNNTSWGDVFWEVRF